MFIFLLLNLKELKALLWAPKGTTGPKPWAAITQWVSLLQPQRPSPNDVLSLDSPFLTVVFQFSKSMFVTQETTEENLWFVPGDVRELTNLFCEASKSWVIPKYISARNCQGSWAQPSSCYNKGTKHRETKTPRGLDAVIDDWFLFLLPLLCFWLPTTQATLPRVSGPWVGLCPCQPGEVKLSFLALESTMYSVTSCLSLSHN